MLKDKFKAKLIINRSFISSIKTFSKNNSYLLSKLNSQSKTYTKWKELNKNRLNYSTINTKLNVRDYNSNQGLMLKNKLMINF